MPHDSKGFDVASPDNAVTTINRDTTAYTTDADGKVTLTFEKSRGCTVSATSSELAPVSPVCIIQVKQEKCPREDFSRGGISCDCAVVLDGKAHIGATV